MEINDWGEKDWEVSDKNDCGEKVLNLSGVFKGKASKKKGSEELMPEEKELVEIVFPETGIDLLWKEVKEEDAFWFKLVWDIKKWSKSFFIEDKLVLFIIPISNKDSRKGIPEYKNLVVLKNWIDDLCLSIRKDFSRKFVESVDSLTLSKLYCNWLATGWLLK